ASPRNVIAPFELNKFCSRNFTCHVATFFHIHVLVICSMKDERRNIDHRKHMPDVNLRIHLVQLHRITGAPTPSQVSCPPIFESLVISGTWSERFNSDRSAPQLSDLFCVLHALLSFRCPWIIWIPETFCIGAINDECRSSLRISCGEERAHRSA